MSRLKVMAVGGVFSCAIVLLLSFLSVRASGAAVITSTVIPSALTAQAGGVATAQAVSPLEITAMPGIPPSDVEPGYYLVLTPQDSGRDFVVPVNALILVRVPISPFTTLLYNPAILQPVPVPYMRPLPAPMPMPAPGVEGTGQPIPASGSGVGVPMQATAETGYSTGGVQVTVMPLPSDTYPNPSAPYPFGSLLRAVNPGTTALSLTQVPCTTRPCPEMPIYNFSVIITVTGRIIPPPPYQTPYPPVGMRADVYIGTAYLMQTVQVQPGQIVELDLPFLAPQEPVTLSYNPQVLQPLDGQNLATPQGGWFFRVIGTGTSDLVVKDNRCLDGSSDCTPSLLFSVTLQSGSAAAGNGAP